MLQQLRDSLPKPSKVNQFSLDNNASQAQNPVTNAGFGVLVASPWGLLDLPLWSTEDDPFV